MTDDRYRAAGVDYGVLDAFKREASALARSTAGAVPGAVEASRGEPAYVVEVGDETLAVVLECLGTKSVLAARYLEESGRDRFAAVGYDVVAAAVNDVVCAGALPLSVNAYFATGSAEWFSDERGASLLEGFARACQDARAVWAGGETPTLRDVVLPDAIDLAASVVGRIPPGRGPILGDELRPGDEIVLVESSGLHTNGATLVRELAGALPDGLRTKLDDGRELGDAALTPTVLYAGLVEQLLARDVPVTYLSHITGHGLRKLMRPQRDLGYRVHTLPDPPAELRLLADLGGLSPAEAYGTFNMGVGFAVLCRPGAGAAVCGIAADQGLTALVGGVVEPGPRRVILEPLGVEFGESTLRLSG